MRFAAHLQGLTEGEAATRLAEYGPNLIRAVSLPVMREILRFSPLPIWTLTAIIAVGIAGGVWFPVAARLGRSVVADNRAQSK